jgi:hypothetical protein
MERVVGVYSDLGIGAHFARGYIQSFIQITMSKTAEELDQKIWSTWLQLDRFSSNPETYIKPFRDISQEYADQQLAEFKEKLKRKIRHDLSIKLCDADKFIELIDSL